MSRDASNRNWPTWRQGERRMGANFRAHTEPFIACGGVAFIAIRDHSPPADEPHNYRNHNNGSD
jgi:hypothetical protein